MSGFHTFALVVFGGRVYDLALATDFVMIAKKFIADGLHPTCLSGIHLHELTTMAGPFLFGREDLRERVTIYDSQEAVRPFYRLDTHGIKPHVIEWIRNVGDQVAPGDRIIIVLIAHGDNKKGGSITLFPQHAKLEVLSKAEMISALSTLPPDVRLLIVNEACFSGSWAVLAPELGARRDVLVETAATVGQRAWSYTSGSGRNRCSLFGAAFVEEITTHPEGRISQHRTRIVDEMLLVGPDQKTSSPVVIPSTRALLSHNISHFLLTPKIATAITNIASVQHRHEALLQSRTSARTFWRGLRNFVGLKQEPAQAFGRDSPARGSNGNDIKAAFIESYLEDLGPLKSAIDHCALVLACQLALEGRGPPGLKDEVIATIGWQATQIQQVGQLLEHLARQGLITDVVDEDDDVDEVDEEALFQLLADDRDIVEPISERFNKIDTLKNMVSPPREGHVPVHFSDGKSWLIGNLDYNRRMYPDSFDLDRVLEEVLSFLA